MENTNTNTKKNHEVVAIIDKSGSMFGKEADTIGGINTTLDVLKNEKDENTNIKISIKLFDHEEELLIRSVDLEYVNHITRQQYIPRGQTALLDAIGNTLTYFMSKKIENNNSYDICTIYIVTDGLENSSKSFNNIQIKDMIVNAEKNYNIKVLYLGANQDAILEANKYGIDASQAMNYSETHETTISAYRSLASATNRHSQTGEVEFTDIERVSSQVSDNNPTNKRHKVEN